jgi:hypothetical protein
MSDDSRIDPQLRARLETASAGLVYGSEGDYPFEFFALPGAAPVKSAREFARLVGAPASARVEEQSWDSMIAWPLSGGDPTDPEAREIATRYARLDGELNELLRNVRVIRVGDVQIRCYVVGEDGKGNLAGLVTTAIET